MATVFELVVNSDEPNLDELNGRNGPATIKAVLCIPPEATSKSMQRNTSTENRPALVVSDHPRAPSSTTNVLSNLLIPDETSRSIPGFQDQRPNVPFSLHFFNESFRKPYSLPRPDTLIVPWNVCTATGRRNLIRRRFSQEKRCINDFVVGNGRDLVACHNRRLAARSNRRSTGRKACKILNSVNI